MPQTLLERDDTLAALDRIVGDAAAGRGSVVLVTGEAGIGKTTLVRAFADEAAARARILLVGLRRPDGAAHARARCATRRCRAAARWRRRSPTGEPVDAVFAALLDELATDGPVVLVVEDVHWADDATLDVLGYAARRIEPLEAVLVLTFRDDEIDGSHSLHRFLGAIVGAQVHRFPLDGLSRDAVAWLSAGSGADADALHRATRGNPFFVTEALASPRDVVPLSVMEAVLSRVRRLGPACREALDQLSVVPSHVGAELAGTLLGPRVDALAEAELAGVLEVGPDSLAFRHELARRAIERSLPAIRRRGAERARRRGAAGRRPPRARARHAPRRRGARRGDDRRRRARRRARGGPRRLAPPGARALRVRAAAPRPAGRPLARRDARRLRLGALQRAPLPRGGRRRPAGREALRGAGRRGGGRRVPRAALPPPVHGRRHRRCGGLRAARRWRRSSRPGDDDDARPRHALPWARSSR